MAGQRLAWHGFAFDLPPGWEITAYRLDLRRGEFRLHERLRERAQLTWVRMASAPDLEAVIREIHDRQLRSSGRPAPPPPHLLRVGRFLVAHAGPGLPFQAVTFVGHDLRLLHWTFPTWEGDDEDSPWRRLLLSCAAEPGDEREWALFGARVVLPRAFTPDEVETLPGAVRLEFRRGDGLSVAVRRFGLARRLLAERPLPAQVRRRMAAEQARVDDLIETRRDGHPAVHCVFSVRGERPWDRVAWRRWPGESWTWHRADENRIHVIEQVGPPSTPRLDLGHACPA